ncbi:hypothetical protein [Fictibacillus arsenicus]|nr:hypothetical protein [Fictibacillus arsenicus]
MMLTNFYNDSFYPVNTGQAKYQFNPSLIIIVSFKDEYQKKRLL